MRQGRRTARRMAGAAALVLALPLGGCALPAAGPATDGVDLARAGCPDVIRIQTDDLPRAQWGFLYRLLDGDAMASRAGGVSAPLVVDGHRTGVVLTILTGDPDDGVSADAELYADESLLLAGVDTDAAILDHVRYPTIGVFAPTAKDSQLVYWSSATYPGVRSIEGIGSRLTPDGSARVPVVGSPGDPFYAYLVGRGFVLEDAIVPEYAGSIQSFLDAGGVAAQQGDLLVDPAKFAHAGLDLPIQYQTLDRAGYERDAGVLSARPQTLVRYADCLAELVPILQRSLVDFVDDSDATLDLIAALSAKDGDPSYDLATAQHAFRTMISEKVVGNGRGDTIGDIDVGRLRELLEDAVPAWEKAGLRVPRDLEPGDLMSNRFIDPEIGL